MRILTKEELQAVSGGGSFPHTAASLAVGTSTIATGAGAGFIIGSAVLPVAGSVIGAGIGALVGLCGGIVYYVAA